MAEYYADAAAAETIWNASEASYRATLAADVANAESAWYADEASAFAAFEAAVGSEAGDYRQTLDEPWTVSQVTATLVANNSGILLAIQNIPNPAPVYNYFVRREGRQGELSTVQKTLVNTIMAHELSQPTNKQSGHGRFTVNSNIAQAMGFNLNRWVLRQWTQGRPADRPSVFTTVEYWVRNLQDGSQRIDYQVQFHEDRRIIFSQGGSVYRRTK